jgi:hypothetical protein
VANALFRVVPARSSAWQPGDHPAKLLFWSCVDDMHEEQGNIRSECRSCAVEERGNVETVDSDKTYRHRITSQRVNSTIRRLIAC